MAKKKFVVTGDDRDVISRRFEDIMRQLRLKKGSTLDPELVKIALQMIDEGIFPEVKNILSGIVHSSYVNAQRFFWLAGEYFIVNSRSGGSNYANNSIISNKPKISEITEEFIKYFGSHLEQVNAPCFIKGRILRICGSKNQISSEVKKETNSKLSTPLKDVYGLMVKKQTDLQLSFGLNSSEGLSMENDNVFFVEPIGSEMRQVILRSYNLGWKVDSKPSDKEIEPGSRIFYRIINKA